MTKPKRFKKVFSPSSGPPSWLVVASLSGIITSAFISIKGAVIVCIIWIVVSALEFWLTGDTYWEEVE